MQGSSKTLSEWLEPFQPKPQEFQIIAQYEASFRKLKESLSEDEEHSVEGRKRLMDRISKLTKRLREQLGEEHHEMHDRPLYQAESFVVRPEPGDDFRIDSDEQERNSPKIP